MNEEAVIDRETLDLAACQRRLIRSFQYSVLLLAMIAMLATPLGPYAPSPPLPIPIAFTITFVLFVVVWVWLLVCLCKTSVFLNGRGVAFIGCVFAFLIPIVTLAIAAYVNHRATKVLADRGVAIGFFGAKPFPPRSPVETD